MNCHPLTIEGLWKKAGEKYMLIYFLEISHVASDYGGETKNRSFSEDGQWSYWVVWTMNFILGAWCSFLINNIHVDSSLISRFLGHERHSGIGKECAMIESSLVLEQSTQKRLWYLYLCRFSELSRTRPKATQSEYGHAMRKRLDHNLN